jgi:hypothetical protein
VHEGNIRRIVVKHDGETVAEFPLTIGVVGVVLAPVFAAVGALIALLADCTIELERVVAATTPVDDLPGSERPDDALAQM